MRKKGLYPRYPHFPVDKMWIDCSNNLIKIFLDVKTSFLYNFDVSVFTRGYYARNSNHTRIREVPEQPAQLFFGCRTGYAT